MKLSQLLPRDYPDFIVIFAVCASPVVTILLVQSGAVAPSILSGILTLLVCGCYGLYGLLVYLNIHSDRMRDSTRDKESHQQEREEMMK